MPLRIFTVTGTSYRRRLATAAATMSRNRSRLPGQRRSPALAGDLGHRAAEVEVDVVGAVLGDEHARPRRRRSPGRRRRAGSSAGARRVVRDEPHRLGRALDQGPRGDHLADVQRRADAPQPEPARRTRGTAGGTRVGDAGHRRQHDGRLDGRGGRSAAAAARRRGAPGPSSGVDDDHRTCGPRSEPAVLLGEPHRLGTGAGAGLADRGGQVVAHRALGQEQLRARCRRRCRRRGRRRSTSVSRAVSGTRPVDERLSAASAGSTTRRPACTRRTASASWRAGVSLTTNPLAPASQRPAQVAGPPERRDDQHPARPAAPRAAPRWRRSRPCRASRRRAGPRRAGARGPRRRPRRPGRPRRRPPGRPPGRAARRARRARGPGRRRAAAGSSCVDHPRRRGAIEQPAAQRSSVSTAPRPRSARSRRPARPRPPLPGRTASTRGPRPSSTDLDRVRRSARTVHRVAPLCRTTLVTPSRTAQANSSRRSPGTSSALPGRSASMPAERRACARARPARPAG